MDAQALIDEMTRRLVEAFAPRSIYLFGSHAWDRPAPESDFDLLVVVDEKDGDSAYRRAVRAHRLLADLPAAKDILVETAEEFSFRAQAPASLEHKIAQEGCLLYGR